ncbi:MAG TPA: fumarylacetoacetate hydrolase family protein [Baekduia sp.]|nr:fumarylacetoacetate hydrolase family protein [Baekduia sp.]
MPEKPLRVRRHDRGLAVCDPDGAWHPFPEGATLDGLLAAGRDALWRAAREAAEAGAEVSAPEACAPVESQEVWAAGVTYERSLDARVAESDGADRFYARIYDAERPELFFKSAGWRVSGPGTPIGIRADAAWNVPEPELAVVLDVAGDIAGYTIGNDVSSRDIEAANPLYLPQAKLFEGCCALGPDIVLSEDLGAAEIRLEIQRAGTVIVDERVSVATLRRRPADLAAWLYRAVRFPVGAVLLTGTGIVPDDAFTLSPDDVVSISIDDIGVLSNPVMQVGTP